MTGHHKFKQLIENISPERKAVIEKKTAKLKQEIALNELHPELLSSSTKKKLR
ncbi:hypothetical protein [Phormidium nigroviride]